LARIDESIRGDRWRALVRWIYRGLAPVYDTARRLIFPEYSEVTSEVLAHLAFSSNDRVLDLGRGTGRVTLPAEAARSVVCVEMTPNKLTKLRQNATKFSCGRERGWPTGEEYQMIC
jgi:ubiquinone/menaquinone biosynthesis C-methylase UbiE